MVYCPVVDGLVEYHRLEGLRNQHDHCKMKSSRRAFLLINFPCSLLYDNDNGR